MILFINIDGLIIDYAKEDEIINNIININFHRKFLSFLKSKNFEKIFLIHTSKRVSEEYLDKKIFEYKTHYICSVLSSFCQTTIVDKYVLDFYNEKDFSIDKIIKEQNINKENCIIIGKNKEHKKDAASSGIRYIDIKSIKNEYEI